jgi:radical SAM superfamily enzyme YgiQ (UPF0313 family)
MGHKKALLVFQTSARSKLNLNIMPPLGILGISSFIDSKGIKNRVVDYNVERLPKLKIDDFEVIMFSVNVANVTNSLLQAKSIKSEFPGKRILFGGPYCTCDPDYFIKQEYIDAVAIGEGEETTYEYITSEDPLRVKGLVFKDRRKNVIFTGDRENIADLDSLPYPAFDKANVSRYNHFPSKDKPISSIVTSRGCVFDCAFCFHTLGYKWRARTPENVVNEIEWQIKELKIKELCIYDDNFTFDEERAEEICNLMLDRDIKINIQFPNGIYINKINKVLLEKLKRIGTHYIGLAPESGNKHTLEMIQKSSEGEQIKEIVSACKKLNIRTLGFFILGFPWEGLGEIKKTIDYAKKIDTDLVQFTRLIPYKKTHIYEFMDNSNLLPADKPDEDKNPFYGASAEVGEAIKMAYRDFYLRSGKIFSLLKVFSPYDLFRLARYAILTRNI